MASTNFKLMFLFNSPLKHQKKKGFLIFSGGFKWEHWPEMGYRQNIIFSPEFT